MQPNSVDDADDARSKYLYNKIFNAIIPYFVAREYNRGPFKLICDDLRFGNILVNNDKDLKIVAIIDWEWAYIAPYQMLFSPPRCLLIKRPSNWDQADIARYKVLAERFTKILEEEDNKRLVKTSMGLLMQQSIDNGQFWFHELVYSCFGFPEDTAWSGIRDILPNIESYATAEQAEVEQFVSFKMEELSRYTTEWAALKQQIEREKAEFEAKVRWVIEETGELDITRNISAANCP
ncbi:uncharacterized protein LDX57_001928 [Aspergillus melleus]|uniref:uncharacterized protein n=1 Tax=Aspergillus melleus TaxID=138277 RepID=UPI001E8CC3A3|nr:uncharacterized protein LDX57_001928 [Aspergillus melleus]KAH8424173.1 hypothetical protein LDX57_001928 [Aspergillus melleus]